MLHRSCGGAVASQRRHRQTGRDLGEGSWGECSDVGGWRRGEQPQSNASQQPQQGNLISWFRESWPLHPSANEKGSFLLFKGFAVFNWVDPKISRLTRLPAAGGEGWLAWVAESRRISCLFVIETTLYKVGSCICYCSPVFMGVGAHARNGLNKTRNKRWKTNHIYLLFERFRLNKLHHQLYLVWWINAIIYGYYIR